MNYGGVSQIFFSGSLLLSPECAEHMLRINPHDLDGVDELPDAIAPSHLVAILESICVREMQAHIDLADGEVVVGCGLECRHRAPIPLGAVVRIDGWVIQVEGSQATFGVQASDEQEIVCEGRIRLAVVQRDDLERKLQRKREAIGRRELFATA